MSRSFFKTLNIEKASFFCSSTLIFDTITVQGGKKSGVCKRKSKIAENFFMTKATDLKTIFLKRP